MSSYRSYTTWGKGGLGSSYGGSSGSIGSGSSYSSGVGTASSKASDSTSTASASSQYDGYGRRPSSGGGSSYRSASSSYRSPYTSSSSLDRSGARDSSSGRYKEPERQSVLEKYGVTSASDRLSLRDKYTYGTYPGRARDEEDDKKDKDEKDKESRSLGRAKTRDSTPEPPPVSFRLYGRGTYSRSTSRDAASDSQSSAASTPATTPVQIPTSLRFGSSTRYGVSIARSPVSEKPPTVFGVASDRYGRVSRRISTEEKKEPPPAADASKTDVKAKAKAASDDESSTEDESQPATVFVTVVTRGTSPTPPSSSSYLRSRRADLARVVEKTVARPATRPPTADKDIQSDRGDDTARLSRFGGTSRASASPWTSYLDRYSSTGSSYTPVSRYASRIGGYGYGASSSSSTRAGDKDASSASTKTNEGDTSSTTRVRDRDTASTATASTDRGVSSSTPRFRDRDTTSTATASTDRGVSSSTPRFRDRDTTSTATISSDRPTSYSTTRVRDRDTASTTTPSSDRETPSSTTRARDRDTASTATASTDRGVSSSTTRVRDKDTASTTTPSSDREAPSSTTRVRNTDTPLSSAKRNEHDVSAAPSSISETNTSSATRSNDKESSSPTVRRRARPASSTPAKTPTEHPPSVAETATRTTAEDSSKTNHSLSESKKDIAKDAVEPSKSSSTNSLPRKDVSRSSSVNKSPTATRSLEPILSELSKKVSEISKAANAEAAAKREGTPKTDVSTPTTKSPMASRTNSSRNLSAKPPTKTESSQPTDPSSPLKTKSSSSSSLSETTVVKTPPLSPSASKTATVQGSPDAASRKLPPPVPKPDSAGVKSSSSMQSLNKLSAANKDFRKSALNVELASNMQAEAFKKLQEKQRKAGKFERKTKRSTSTSSGDSEEASSQSGPAPTASVAAESSPVLRGSKSMSRLSSGGPAPNFLQVPSSGPRAASPKRRSPARSKSRSPATRSGSSSETSSSDSSTSSDSSSSSSSSSSDDDDDDERSVSRPPAVNIRQRPIRSPSAVEKRKSTLSTGSARTSSADESSISADKPPRPPSTPKHPPKTDEAKSFLMRALAPVTNLFKMKQQESEITPSDSNENISTPITKVGSKQSLSNDSEKEDNKKSKPKKHRIRHIESGERAWWLDPNNENIPEGILRLESNKSIARLAEAVAELQKSNSNSKIKFKITKQESGERAWWLDSNANIPEGIQRILSNASIHQSADSDSDKKSPEGLKKIKSCRSIARLHEELQLYKIRHQESGEKAWWLSSSGNIPEGMVQLPKSSTDSPSSSSESEDEERKKADTDKPVEDGSMVPKFPLVLPTASRKDSTGSAKEASPKAAETKEESGRQSPYDNVQEQAKAEGNKKEKTPVKTPAKRPKNLPLFISNHTNIDDILGSAASLVDPVMGLARLKKGAASSDEEDLEHGDGCEEVDPSTVRIHDSTAQTPSILHLGNAADENRRRSSGMIKLDDTALQLYKDGDYGSYLDLEASINEQHEEFDGFQANRKNSIVLRTQLSVRVHTIIEKLLNSEGRELRRALFSLKQIFQEDKDLVHEFVQNDGLACLIKVGSEADQNYQNYILRALGQVMLYVDGMNGVMEHNQTVQWLYTLIASKFRLVVKTALKLLLVFVEYVETNCLLLIKAVNAVDTSHGLLPWSNIIKLLKDYDAADTELLIYATTLVNKTLNGIPDQDTYYDQVDALEEQGIEGTIQRYMSKQGTDLDLLRQFQIYEAVLHHEDGEEKGTPLKQLDEAIRKTLRNRKSLNDSLSERRKSRRHSTGTSPLPLSVALGNTRLNSSTLADEAESESSSARSSPGPGEMLMNGTHKEGKGDVGVTPALRRRRERAERQRSFIREQQETAATLKATLGTPEDDIEDENQKLTNSLSQRINNGSFDGGDVRASNKLQLNRVSSRKDLTPLLNAVNAAESENKATDSNGILKKPWVLSMMYGKNTDGSEAVEGGEGEEGEEGSEMKVLLQLKRENTVKDLTQKLASQNILHSPVEEGNNKINRIGDMTGLISKAKEGLAKSKSKADVIKSPTGENVPKLLEVKKSETELHWEELMHAMSRPLSLCDLDFTDLKSEDEVDVLSPAHVSNGGPPPPPPVPMAPGMPRNGAAPPPPPPVSRFSNGVPPPPAFGVNLRSQRNGTAEATSPDSAANKALASPSKKTKKTVKLFWKEVRDDPIILAKLQKTGMIWDEMSPVLVDTQKLEHLFESRAKDLITKEKQQEMNKNKEVIVLDHKRSNAINIGMTKLPPPRSIKTAILKMDATIMNREGIEKLLTMLPTEEERSKIQEAQVANPDLPLGSAEQFLLTLASISELPARLKLWAFKLDYENSEKEIAEPLMDLKQGIETLKANKTFRGILSTLLSIGIFLNGNEVKGFQIEYLAKVPEVKDTVHKHSLLHHLCHMVMDKFPDASDLYSEIGAVTRASKVDFDELAANIMRMEQECKASWDHLKVIAKHDGSTMMKVKMSDFLADCAERIIVLGIVHRRVMNRFHKFLLWLGIPLHRVQDMKPNEFCRIVSEFALEYRTTRERVLQQLEKKANHRERNKTRGKMITEVGKFRTKEDRADAELRQLLGSDISDAESIHGSLPWRRQRKDLGRTVLSPLIRDETVNGNITDGDDEILESLVKTATKAPTTRTTPRERKRTRHADRKSLKRSRTRENNTLEGGRESP